jgi:hypothetical protein
MTGEELLPPSAACYRWICGFFIALLLRIPAEAQSVNAGDENQSPQVRSTAFFVAHCYKCHDEKTEGDLSIRKLDTDIIHGKDVQVWQEVLHRLNFGDMPPKEETPPKTDDLLETIDWLTLQLAAAESSNNPALTARLPRRLTNREYRNTLRNLTAYPHDPTREFSQDPQEGGFRNNAGALRMSPREIDNYYVAAQDVLARAARPLNDDQVSERWIMKLRSPGLPKGGPGSRGDPYGYPELTEEQKEFPVREGTTCSIKTFDALPSQDGGVVDWRYDLFNGETEPPTPYAKCIDLRVFGVTKGNIRRSVGFRWFGETPGTYRVTIEVSSGPRLPETADQSHSPFEYTRHLTVLLQPDNRMLGVISPTDEKTRHTFTFHREPSLDYFSMVGHPGWGIDLELYAREKDKVIYGPQVHSMELEGPLSVEWNAQTRDKLFPNQHTDIDDEQYAHDVLESFITRAFRRPPTARELNRYTSDFLSLRRGETDNVAALSQTFAAVLVSPAFLYRFETETEKNARLNDWQLASRLSYFLWKSMPDEELFAAAAGGKLSTNEELRGQVRWMLRSTNHERMAEDFTRQWLELDKLEKHVSTPTEDFDLNLKYSMIAETLATVREALAQNRSALSLLSDNHAMLNGRMATHYGIKGVEGSEFRRVSLPGDSHRGGILTQAALLTLTSKPKVTDPIHRGAFLMDRVFGRKPPPPPPDVNLLTDFRPKHRPQSKRELVELHRTTPSCVNCHARFDPVGFALENYDHLGRWRDFDKEYAKPEKEGSYRGGEIDVGGRLPDGRPFSGVEDLKRLLKDDPTLFVDNLIAKLTQYALGRRLGITEMQQVRSIRRECESKDYRLHDILEAIVLSDMFRQR